MSYTDGFVNAYITLIILGVTVGIVGLLLQMVPKNIQEKLFQKLHLDSDTSYDDVDED